MRNLIAGILILVAAGTVCAQESGPDIGRYIGMIEKGQEDHVKAELPALLSRYPDNPGVMYLQGLTTTDAAEAVRIYQSIVDNFPKSEWADESLYKVYQFYYSLGLYRTADMKMAQLKKEYPKSKFAGIVPVPDVPQAAAAGSASTSTPPPDTSGQQLAPPVDFALQVGAYTTQENAEKQKLFFEDLGYSVEIISKMKDQRSLFLVLVGSYPSYDAAKAKGAEIKEKYKIGSVVLSK